MVDLLEKGDVGFYRHLSLLFCSYAFSSRSRLQANAHTHFHPATVLN